MSMRKGVLYFAFILIAGVILYWLVKRITAPIIVLPPAEKEITKIDTDGVTVLPNGRFVTPAGKNIIVAPHPYGLVLSPDDNTIVTANSGISPLSITIIRGVKTGKFEVQQIPPGPQTDKGVLASVFMGLAISPDNRVVYVAGGEENKIFIFDLRTGEKLGYIDCSQKNSQADYSTGYIGDLTLSKDGRYLFAVDQINFRMVVVDTLRKKVIANASTGRYPFGIALSPDEKYVYVANVGMYEYKRIKGIDMNNLKDTAPNFPTSAFLSQRSIKGYKTSKYEVPGLGDPNVPESFSVWTIDITNIDKPFVAHKTKTGHLVGELVEGIPAVGGSSPNSIVATDDYVFVSNGNNDSISVIETKTFNRKEDIKLFLDKRLKRWRGIIPFGLALSPDGKRLYVAESGINAIGVIDVRKMKVIGHIPAGWFPSKLAITSDGTKLFVANAKGYGSGPNGGKNFKGDPELSYIGYLMKGTVSIIDVPDDTRLKEYTKVVVRNNFRFKKAYDLAFRWRKKNPVPLYPGQKSSPIKYIVYISKENRTFDEVFGQIKGANGDPSLARFGERVSFSNKAGTSAVENTTVMPNHLKLAREFAIADNFYVDSDVSADGHRWLVNTYPNEWVESTVPANYGGNRYYIEDSKSPGILGIWGASGAIYPEDYNEAGSMWEHLERHNIEFYNFGFGIMFEPASYDPSYLDTGMRYIANFPMPAPLYSRTSRSYPTFNMGIPDQFRVSRFIKEFKKKWLDEKKPLPKIITIILPNDHGAGERPQSGYPFFESYMADNDLALGRIVEFLSHTPYWKNMAIFITEDDAQGGVDHVDAHRSILMVVSPWVKRGFVAKTHYSFGSLFKTFWNILGVPYLNQYDAGAHDLAEFFTEVPDFTPYRAVPVDRRVFDPEKALTPFDEKFDWEYYKNSPRIDNVNDMIKFSKEKKEWRISK